MANPDRFVEIAGTRFRVEEEGAFITFSLEHERVHLGSVYHGGTYAATVANDGTLLLSVAAGTVQSHVNWHVAVGGNSVVSLIEGGTLTGYSTANIYNRNRGASGTPLASVYTGGTVTGGTTLEQIFIPGGSGGLRQGGAGRADNEWITAVSKNFTVKLVNISGGNIGASVNVDWYEATEV